MNESPGGSEREKQSGETSASESVDPRLAMLADDQAKDGVSGGSKASPSGTVRLKNPGAADGRIPGESEEVEGRGSPERVPGNKSDDSEYSEDKATVKVASDDATDADETISVTTSDAEEGVDAEPGSDSISLEDAADGDRAVVLLEPSQEDSTDGASVEGPEASSEDADSPLAASAPQGPKVKAAEDGGPRTAAEPGRAAGKSGDMIATPGEDPGGEDGTEPGQKPSATVEEDRSPSAPSADGAGHDAAGELIANPATEAGEEPEAGGSGGKKAAADSPEPAAGAAAPSGTGATPVPPGSEKSAAAAADSGASSPAAVAPVPTELSLPSLAKNESKEDSGEKPKGDSGKRPREKPEKESSEPAASPPTAAEPPKAAPEPAATATALPTVGKARAGKVSPTAGPPAPAQDQDSPERTKQQPVPPVPPDPMKLLADLTNTPPPPDTPLRTLARRVKIWTPLAFLLLIILGIAQLIRPLPAPSLGLSVPAAYSFKGTKPEMPWPSEGQAAVNVQGLGTLGSAGGAKPRPIASVTKVMTAYVILKEHPLKKGVQGPAIEVDQEAQDHYERGLPEHESVLKVRAGEKISESEALQALLIPSANNVARLLARWDSGSEKSFVKKMNQAAKELGMADTTYTDPSGLAASTVSTARDQVKLGEAAMRDPVFREIVNTGMYRPKNSGTDVYNHNLLLHRDGVIGLKTGNSTAAGANLLFAAEKEVGGTTQLVVGAVLGQRGAQPGQAAANASRALILAAQSALTSTKVAKRGGVVGYVDDGLGTRSPVTATKDVIAVGWPGLSVRSQITARDGGIPHKADSGEKVGTLTVGGGPRQVKVLVKLESATAEPSIGARLLRIL